MITRQIIGMMIIAIWLISICVPIIKKHGWLYFGYLVLMFAMFAAPPIGLLLVCWPEK
jgi:hypothetical protein